MLSHLPESSVAESKELINQFYSLFSDTLGCTNMTEHDVDMGDSKPIKQLFYRVKLEKHKYLDSEVDYMLENGIPESCMSSWASHCILVPKSDITPRFCTDYMKLNTVTKPGCFPLPRIKDC